MQRAVAVYFLFAVVMLTCYVLLLRLLYIAETPFMRKEQISDGYRRHHTGKVGEKSVCHGMTGELHVHTAEIITARI